MCTSGAYLLAVRARVSVLHGLRVDTTELVTELLVAHKGLGILVVVQDLAQLVATPGVQAVLLLLASKRLLLGFGVVAVDGLGCGEHAESLDVLVQHVGPGVAQLVACAVLGVGDTVGVGGVQTLEQHRSDLGVAGHVHEEFGKVEVNTHLLLWITPILLDLLWLGCGDEHGEVLLLLHEWLEVGNHSHGSVGGVAVCPLVVSGDIHVEVKEQDVVQLATLSISDLDLTVSVAVGVLAEVRVLVPCNRGSLVEGTELTVLQADVLEAAALQWK